jgi:hypothetical protein
MKGFLGSFFAGPVQSPRPETTTTTAQTLQIDSSEFDGLAVPAPPPAVGAPAVPVGTSPPAGASLVPLPRRISGVLHFDVDLSRGAATATGGAAAKPARPRALATPVDVPPPVAVAPSPPKGVLLFYQDANGRPTKARDAYMWTWEKALRWYYVSEHPIPGGHPTG